MLGEIIDLERMDATLIIDSLYDVFHDDFVANRTYLAEQIYIDPQSHRISDGKEQTFWHLTTRQDKYTDWVNGKKVQVTGDRYTDFQRASRLRWVKNIILNHSNPSIKSFFFRETNKKKDIRLYLWAEEEDFVVILQKLGRSSSFLVTSFYITHAHKRTDYLKRYQDYINDTTGLRSYSWFQE